MSNPFSYQKAKHVRTRTPPPYTNYRQFKADLQQEFVRRCVYCRAFDTVKGFEGFGVDHYRPKRFFPHLSVRYSNLYYCCNRCNSNKGQFWPSRPQQVAKVFIPNPCDHVMRDHMRFHDAEVFHKSAAGEFTIEILDLNEQRVVDLREALVVAVSAIEEKIRGVKSTNSQIKKLRKRAKSAAQKNDLDNELSNSSERLRRLTEALRQFLPI